VILPFFPLLHVFVKNSLGRDFFSLDSLPLYSAPNGVNSEFGARRSPFRRAFLPDILFRFALFPSGMFDVAWPHGNTFKAFSVSCDAFPFRRITALSSRFIFFFTQGTQVFLRLPSAAAPIFVAVAFVV